MDFQVNRGRMWLTITGWAVTAVILTRLIAMLIAGSATVDASDMIPLVAGPVGASAAFALLRRDSLARIRLTEAGIAFTPTLRRPMFLPWSSVAAVERRLMGSLTRLVIIPDRVENVRHLEGTAPVQRPHLRRGRPSFTVVVGSMTPGPDALFAELNRIRTAHPA
ncbi:hypothetical protein, partial [Actinoplanes rectilineatus]